MDGCAALVAVAIADAALTALVPAAKIMAGPLPQGTSLPAITFRRVSTTTRSTLVKGATTFVRERVQGTVHAVDYDSQTTIQKALIKAAHATFPDVTGLINVTVHHDSGGPDFMNEEASIYLGSEDFRVTYSEER
ncbi:DUF3168 domain-containing protein [Novosphingobium sp. KN65.2]|uniref:tail completion protein gp17 n=1 Tax=Novosphingobium sp. KN65.2 TaxID=1478134 RepID=UPI0005DC2D0E|nr:DUF3168 domain-containing protein [Novosphingobium sp. KN65.2]CDO34998.1 conserved hypothetical protein [Novosphingobium sp. KN65.2]